MTIVRVESLDDPRVAIYRDTARPRAIARRGLFVAEGRLVVERLLRSSRFRVHSVLVTPTALEALRISETTVAQDEVRNRPSAEAVATPPADTPVYVVDQTVMNQIVGFNIHRGCLALGERPAIVSLEQAPIEAAARLLVVEGVNNPDNIGGLFRCAAAFGADAVVLGPGSGDPLYRKAIRTSMAASLQVPFVEAGPWPDALSHLRGRGFRVLALTPGPAATPIDALPRGGGRVALLVGSEAAGLSSRALAAADERVRIPMHDGVDSLNVTVAAAIAMHHCF